MIEFLQECVNYVNLPATLMMIGVLLYWLMVMVGVFGMDAADVDFDFDADVGLDADIGLDADVGFDADVGIDADVGLDANTGIDTAPGTSFGGSSTTGNDGIFKQVFDFFYLGEVPIVIIATFFVLAFWVCTVMTNHWYNQEQTLLISMLCLIPNILVSLAVTRIAMIPFIIIFKKPPPEDVTRQDLYGQIGVVTSLEVTDKYGQIEIQKQGDTEMRFNVRCEPGKTLARGDAAKIISWDQTDGTFLVELTKWEKSADG